MEPLLTIESLIARFFRLYYLANLQSCLLLPILKILHWFPFSEASHLGFSTEFRIYGLIACLVFFKIRSSATLEETFSILFLYLKLASILLLYYSSLSIFYPVIYLLSCLVLFAVMPQPPYYGPGEVIPLNKEALDIFIKPSDGKSIKGKNEVRILLLDTLWSSRCLNFQAVPASLSLKYTTPSIKFGRIDLDEDPSYEARFKVDASATSLQLPTLILFVDGTEKARLPNARSDSSESALSLWNRTEESVITAFDLRKYYTDSTASLD